MKKLISEQKISYHAKLAKIVIIYFILGMGMGMLNSTHAIAENWVKLNEVNTTESYIDMDSMKKFGSFVQYWQKVVFHDRLNKLDTIQTLNEVECTNSQFRIIHAIGYWQDDTSLDDNTIRNWETITPDTPNEIAYHYACKNKFID